jgi:hypothetical protein
MQTDQFDNDKDNLTGKAFVRKVLEEYAEGNMPKQGSMWLAISQRLSSQVTLTSSTGKKTDVLNASSALGRPTDLHSAPHFSGLNLASIATVLIFAVGLGVLIGRPLLNGNLGFALSPTKENTTSRWDHIWNLARVEAVKLDKDNVPMWISQLLNNCTDSSGASSIVTFIFLDPTGRRSRVQIRDTNPPSLVRVDPEYDTISPIPSKQLLDSYSRVMTYVRLSPREACEIAWPEIQPLIQKEVDGIVSVKMYLDLDLDKNRTAGLPSVWQVSYDTASNMSFDTFVSPVDGAVIRRQLSKDGSTPVTLTPSVAPSAQKNQP